MRLEHVRVNASLQRRRWAAWAQRPVTAPVAVTAPDPALPTPSDQPTPATELSWPPPVSDVAGAAEPSRAEASTRSIQNVLLTLGAILSATAIVVFTTVAWATFGSTGRALILTAITTAMLAVPLWLRRRGLRATAETLAGLAIVMIPCDAVALYYLDLWGGTSSTALGHGEPAPLSVLLGDIVRSGIDAPGLGYCALALGIISLLYRMVTRMLVPGFAAFITGVIAGIVFCLQSNVLIGTAGTMATVGANLPA
ncbi:MAG: hypothetical protein ACRD0P_33345, partial [Stackebrandtia sp.]